MTGRELWIALGDIHPKYYEEAETGTFPARKPLRRPLLIAALVALMLLLVGCAVYVLSLQGLIVGEHVPLTSRNSADHIPSGTEEKISLISLQNVNHAAMAQWLEFKQNYDTDGALMAANDNNESGIPERYYQVYHCYTWEMVEKLEEITKQYDLQLLSQNIDLPAYAYQVLYDALGIPNIVRENANVDVEYLDSYFYPEGTFDSSLLITLPKQEAAMLVGVHYSQKAYFDPAVGSVGDISHYEQWHYTRTDGVEVLLAVDENTARIYADLPHAFVSIQTNAISKKALEQLSEIFDFTIQPSSASLEEIHTLLSAAENRNDAQISQQEKALYENGYAEYVTQLMEKYADFPTGTEYMTYALKDINADGYDELIVCNFEDNLIEILTTNGNDSFHYFDASLLAASRINLYEGNVIGIFDTYEDNGVLYEFNYYFFHADPKGASFITGLHKNEDGTWDKFLEHPEPDPKAWKTESITEADARNILQSFAPIQWERKPISEYPFE